MDMMFNTEVIVKDMKGGKEDMTENKRFEIKPSAMYNNKYVIHDSKKEYTFPILDSTLNYMFCKALNELNDENKQLKQYKQSVNDVLKSWSQKNLTAKQLQVVLAIMEELNIIGDVE